MQQFIGVIEMTVVLIEFDMSDCCGRARLCFERSRSSHDLCVLAHVHMINSAARKQNRRQKGCTPTSARLVPPMFSASSSCTSIHNIPAHVSEVSGLYEHIYDRHIHTFISIIHRPEQQIC